MTVSTTTSRVEYAGNGATTAFSVPFYFLANGDLKVYQAGTLKTLTTHYTVTGAANPAGGTVTFVTAPAADEAVVVLRDPALTQSTDYAPNDPFPAESHERALDRLTMIAQRNRDLMERSVRVADGETEDTDLTLPALEDRRNKTFYWNADGEPSTADVSAVTVTFSPDVQSFSGTGAQTAFTLAEAPGSAAALVVAISGVMQTPGTDYNVSGTTLTFTSAPPAGAGNVVVQNFGIARAVNTMDADAVTYTPNGSGAVNTDVQTKLREFVSVKDFGAVEGGDVGAAVNLALAAGHTMIRVEGSYTLSTSIVLNALSRVILDLSDASITAASGLNASLIRLISCTRCEVRLGFLDGNAAGQTSSSFGIDLNGGTYNKVIGGRVTNCKTYGIYNINCQYAVVSGVEVDNCQQSGIAGDSGGSNCVGFQIKNVVVHDNGLGGVGATSGLYLEGDGGAGTWFTELSIDGVVAYNNRGAGVAGQRWQFYSLRNIKSRQNYSQGIALFACLYGTGGDFVLNNNDVSASAGYDNGLSIDETSVTPASQYNTFTNIFSANHAGYAVIERGTANNNSFIGVDSVSDGAVFAFVGASSIGLRRNVLQGSVSFTGQFVGNSAASGVGYGAGAGGSVTQGAGSGKSTAVTLNAPTGRITMNNAALGAGALVEFILTNSAISSTDHILFNVVGGATQAAYIVNARPLNGQATIEVRNMTAGSLSEAIIIGFAVIKGSVA